MIQRLLTLSFAAVLLLASVAAAADRPNVLFFTMDDMNWDSVGVFGCKVPRITPNIDRLASEGMRFTHGHVTIAICMPTRAVWMTGRYPHRSGALGFDKINADVPSLPEALKRGGYFNGLLAKTPHVVPTRHHAFDVIVHASELGVGRDPQLFYQHSKAFFAEARTTGKPFFLMANSQDPHRPFPKSQQEAGRISGGKKAGARAGAKANAARKRPNRFPGVSRTYKPEEVTVPGFLPDVPDVRKEVAQYFTAVHRADEMVGSVLKALDEAGYADNTLVMFVSDHGMAFPFAKTNCWHHSTKTPWIIRWPGVVTPGRVDREHFVSGIDFAPTILDVAGIDPLPGADGRSFLPVIRGEPQDGRERVFTHLNRTAGRNEYPMRAVQDEKFIYIFNAWPDGSTRFKNESQSGLTMNAMIRAAEDDATIASRVKHFLYRTPEEFYDVKSDPDGRNNLVDDPRYKEQIDTYRRLMREHLKAVDDPQLKAFCELVKME